MHKDWEAEVSLPAIGWSRSGSCLVEGRSCGSTGPRPPGCPQRCGLPAARRGLTAPAEGEGNEGFPPPPNKGLESPF